MGASDRTLDEGLIIESVGRTVSEPPEAGVRMTAPERAGSKFTAASLGAGACTLVVACDLVSEGRTLASAFEGGRPL